MQLERKEKTRVRYVMQLKSDELALMRSGLLSIQYRENSDGGMFYTDQERAEAARLENIMYRIVRYGNNDA